MRGLCNVTLLVKLVGTGLSSGRYDRVDDILLTAAVWHDYLVVVHAAGERIVLFVSGKFVG